MASHNVVGDSVRFVEENDLNEEIKQAMVDTFVSHPKWEKSCNSTLPIPHPDNSTTDNPSPTDVPVPVGVGYYAYPLPSLFCMPSRTP